MTSATLRLESFGIAAPRVLATAADVEQAYQDGHERGLHQGRAASLDALVAEMARLRQSLQLLDQEQQRIRQQTLAAVVPALSLIIDLLGPAGARARLLSALEHELARLVSAGEPGRLRIRCAPDLRPDIQLCLDRAGLRAGFEDGAEDAGVELGVEGGSIRFDAMRPVAELRNIIDELRIEE